MSPATRRPREIETPPPAPQRQPLLYSLFLLQALLVLIAGLFGNGLAERLRMEPVVPFLWTVLLLVIVALVGLILLRMDEVAPRAGRRTAAPRKPAGLGGLLDAALGRPITAFPLALLLGTLIAALAVQAVPRGDAPLGLLWGYEVAAFLVTLVPTYLAVARTRDLMALLGLWLGLAFGMSEGLLLLRPEENGPLFTTLGWVVAVCLPGLLFRSRFLQGLFDRRRVPLRDRAARGK